MAIQLRSGAYADYNPAQMHAAEAAVILSGDPETADGKSMRIAFGAGDDKRLLTEDDASAIDDAMSEKATINSPTFTGTPAAPTPSVETNNTQIATTGFVRLAIVQYGINGTITPVVTNGNLTFAVS